MAGWKKWFEFSDKQEMENFLQNSLKIDAQMLPGVLLWTHLMNANSQPMQSTHVFASSSRFFKLRPFFFSLKLPA